MKSKLLKTKANFSLIWKPKIIFNELRISIMNSYLFKKTFNKLYYMKKKNAIHLFTCKLIFSKPLLTLSVSWEIAAVLPGTR